MITDGVSRPRTVLDNGLLILSREVRTRAGDKFLDVVSGGEPQRKARTDRSLALGRAYALQGHAHLPPGSDFDRLVEREGGYFNGMTWIDWTTYYETLPSDRIDLALRIESDRMVNSLFDPAETESERTVIISEREGSENRPTYLLFEQVQALSFLAHPYHHMVIGWKEDLRAITRDDLYRHYRTYYAPNNAVIVVVGRLRDRTHAGVGSTSSSALSPPASLLRPCASKSRLLAANGECTSRGQAAPTISTSPTACPAPTILTSSLWPCSMPSSAAPRACLPSAAADWAARPDSTAPWSAAAWR